MERVCQCVTKHIPMEDVAVVQGNAPREAEELAGADTVDFSPDSRGHGQARVGHRRPCRPGTVLVALRESQGEAEKADGKARARKFTLPTLRIPRRQ